MVLGLCPPYRGGSCSDAGLGQSGAPCSEEHPIALCAMARVTNARVVINDQTRKDQGTGGEDVVGFKTGVLLKFIGN